MSELTFEQCRIPGCYRPHLGNRRIPLCHVHHDDFVNSPECLRMRGIKDDGVDVGGRCAVAVMDFIHRTDREAENKPKATEPLSQKE